MRNLTKDEVAVVSGAGLYDVVYNAAYKVTKALMNYDPTPPPSAKRSNF